MVTKTLNAIRIVKVFQELFQSDPLIVSSPSRVNLLGEHTDYNNGFVLPASIDKMINVAVSKREDYFIHLHALEYNDTYVSSMSTVHPTHKRWPNYVLGIVDQLNKLGCPLSGFNILIQDDVPPGSGLSSSAALECATIYALNELFSLDMDRMTMVLLAQKAEHVFADVQCGIMDQFASMFGKKNNLIKLDCQSFESEYVPLNLDAYKILLLYSNVQHSLASSEYNNRRQECEQGVEWIKEFYPQVTSLRDISLEILKQHVQPKDQLVYQRCKYVLQENNRVLEACEDLQNGNIRALGNKMFLTHEGLSKQYEVSCKELDILVKGVKGEYGVLGAHMMGEGFGGCTINLVKIDVIDKIIEEAYRRYKIETGLELTAHIAQIENGTQIIKPLTYDKCLSPLF